MANQPKCKQSQERSPKQESAKNKVSYSQADDECLCQRWCSSDTKKLLLIKKLKNLVCAHFNPNSETELGAKGKAFHIIKLMKSLIEDVGQEWEEYKTERIAMNRYINDTVAGRANWKMVDKQRKAKKSSYNPFGKFYFRKSEDILEAIKPFLIEHGVTVTINEEMISTDPVPTMQSTATISDGENAIHATALVGVDLNQKGMQTAQQFGAASTYGKKYALGNLFLIDDTEDADANNKHGVVDKIKAKKFPPAKSTITADQMKKAIEFCKAGGSVEAIKTKYKLNAAQEANLELDEKES